MTLGCVLSSDANQGEPNREQNNPDQADQPTNAAAAINPGAGNPEDPNAGDNQNPSESLQRFLAERALDPVTWFTGGLFWLAILQYRTMRRQGGYMREGLDETRASIAEATRSAKAMEAIASAMRESADSVKSSLTLTEDIAKTNASNLKLASTVVLSLQKIRQHHRDTSTVAGEALVCYEVFNTGGIPAEVSHIICKFGLLDTQKWRSKRPVGEIFAPNTGHSFCEVIPLNQLTAEEWDAYGAGKLTVTMRVIAFVTNPLGETRAQVFGRRLACGRQGLSASFVFNETAYDESENQEGQEARS